MKLKKEDLKRLATKFRMFINKIANNEEFDAADIDTSAETTDSKEVLRAKVVDKIEQSKGVDLTANVYRASINKKIADTTWKANSNSNLSGIKAVNKKDNELVAKVNELDKKLDSEKVYSKTTLTRDPFVDDSKKKVSTSNKDKLSQLIADYTADSDNDMYTSTDSNEEDLYDTMDNSDEVKELIADLDGDDSAIDISG